MHNLSVQPQLHTTTRARGAASRTSTGACCASETRPGPFVLLSLSTCRLHSMRYNILYIIMHAPDAMAREHNDTSAEHTALRPRRTARLAQSVTNALAAANSRPRPGTELYQQRLNAAIATARVGADRVFAPAPIDDRRARCAHAHAASGAAPPEHAVERARAGRHARVRETSVRVGMDYGWTMDL